MTPASPPRIQGLDGLRALSIALVLLGHLTGTRGFYLPEWTLAFLGNFALGTLGVRVFFVISGFLITTLLSASTNGAAEYRCCASTSGARSASSHRSIFTLP